MVIDEKRKAVAQTILKRGWIEATPENLEAYFDGFVMADKRSAAEIPRSKKKSLLHILEPDATIYYPEIITFFDENPPKGNKIPGITVLKSEGERGGN